jgi:hypothetical protein
MKNLKSLLLSVLALVLLGSCNSVRVLSDYDQKANFNEYKSYAFYKTGIDKAEISDLDKKRILRAVETEMSSRGFLKSDNPDILISIFTKEQERVDIYNNNFGWGGMGGWGWGGMGGWGMGGWGMAGMWGPGLGWGWGGGGNMVSTSTEGSLYIDLIDTKTKQLVWQGKGEGTLADTRNRERKEQRINEFVSQIMEQYPPSGIVAN